MTVDVPDVEDARGLLDVEDFEVAAHRLIDRRLGAGAPPLVDLAQQPRPHFVSWTVSRAARPRNCCSDGALGQIRTGDTRFRKYHGLDAVLDGVWPAAMAERDERQRVIYVLHLTIR